MRRRSRSATAPAASIAPATTAAFAALLLEHPDATIVAGATDVGLWVTKQQRVLPAVIYIGRVRDLRGIRETGGRASRSAPPSPMPRRSGRSAAPIPTSAS